ncbi:MAG: hypothetical protein WBD00_04220, partial [Candidatus Omnitrophota bacterium]
VPDIFSVIPGVGTYVNILSRLKGAERAVLTETFYVKCEDGTETTLQRFSEGIMIYDMFIPDLNSTARFEGLDSFEGATFDYIAGDTVIQLSVGEDHNIYGELPCAAMGLDLDLGGRNYEIDSIGIKMEGLGFIVDDDNFLNVNGIDRQGTWFMETDESMTDAMFLYDGAELRIKGNILTIESGEAFFGAIESAPDGKLIPLLRNIDDEVISPDMGETLLEKLGNAIVPYAHAESALDAVMVSEDTYEQSAEGIIPTEGEFGIINNKAFPREYISALAEAGQSEGSKVSFWRNMANFLKDGILGAKDWTVDKYNTVKSWSTEAKERVEAQKAEFWHEINQVSERTLNRIVGLGPYTKEEYKIQMDLALEAARSIDLDGSIVFSAGRGPIQGVTRFGELSGFGEEKNDVFELFANPVGSVVKFGAKYIENVFSTKDVVPHHSGMARIMVEKASDGQYVNYVMQINPEGPTKVPIEKFAEGNLMIMIIKPKRGGEQAAALWSTSSFDPDTLKSISGRSYDFFRLIGWGSNHARGTQKAICSENVYFRLKDWADAYMVDPLPGVRLDNRITPWDEYKARHIWDEDMVKKFVRENPERAKEIIKSIN